VRSADDLNTLSGKAEVAAFCSNYFEWQRNDGSDVAAEKMESMIAQISG
jgi:tryptophan synthase alpha chain